MKHTEYGVLVTTPEHTYLDSTHMTETAAEDRAATFAQGMPGDIYTIAKREVEVILGEWESIGIPHEETWASTTRRAWDRTADAWDPETLDFKKGAE